jgi:hypothetical protein
MTATVATRAAPGGQIGTKLRRVGDREGYPHGGIGHWCPACRVMHVFALWKWDDNAAAPTFIGDNAVPWGDQVDAQGFRRRGGVCHYTLIAGMLEFLSDSAHSLRGQRLPLPDLPGHLVDSHRS